MTTENNTFEIRWTNKIEEIKKISLSTHQSLQIFEGFRSELEISILFEKINSVRIIQITEDLILALFQANNNYKKEFPSIWNQFHKLKLPNIDINSLKVGK